MFVILALLVALVAVLIAVLLVLSVLASRLATREWRWTVTTFLENGRLDGRLPILGKLLRWQDKIPLQLTLFDYQGLPGPTSGGIIDRRE